jgi:DNA-binding transcriptional regulator/RsmH inhibitor MraZ
MTRTKSPRLTPRQYAAKDHATEELALSLIRVARYTETDETERRMIAEHLRSVADLIAERF